MYISIKKKISVDEKSWSVLIWLTIGYFLTLIYIVTSIAIVIEWCKRQNNNNDIVFTLDFDRGIVNIKKREGFI